MRKCKKKKKKNTSSAKFESEELQDIKKDLNADWFLKG